MFHHIRSCWALALILLFVLLCVAPRNFNQDWDPIVLALYKQNNLPPKPTIYIDKLYGGGKGYNMQTE